MRYRERKLKYYYDMIDNSTRESILLSKITTSLIKCIHRFDYYRLQNALTNNNEIEETYPRYSKVEMQKYVVKYEKPFYSVKTL